MRGFRYIFPLLLFSLLFSTNNAQAQWEKTDFPKTLVDTYTLFAKGDTILAGTERGVYFSSDKGNSWQQYKSIRKADVEAFSFAYNDDYLFVGHKFGVDRFSFPLENSSQERLTYGLEGDSKKISSLLQHNGYLFAGTRDGFYRSSDNGSSWEPAGDVFTGYSKNIKSTIAVEDTLFVVVVEKVARSHDNGENWTDVVVDSTFNVRDLIYESGYLVATIAYNGVYQSDDYGKTWTKVNNDYIDDAGLNAPQIHSITSHNGTIYVGTNQGLIKSSDFGENWSLVSEQVHNHTRPFQAIAVTDGDIFAGTEGGLYRTSDNGANWTEISDVSRFLVVRELQEKGDSLLAGTDLGLYNSIDNGMSWTPLFTGTGEDSTYVLSLSVWNDDIFAGTKDGIFRSTDGGVSWKKVYAGTSSKTKHVQTLAVWQNQLFAGTKYGVYRSSDGGQTWQDANTGFGQYPIEVSVIKGFDQYLFAGSRSTVFRSSDNGDNWEEAGKLVQYGTLPINAFFKKDNTLFAGTSTMGVFKSLNDGQTWIHSNSGIPKYGAGNNSWARSFAQHNDYLFTATHEGVYYSNNNGTSWEAWNDGLEDEISLNFQSLAVQNGYLLSGTYEIGVTRRPLSQITTSNELAAAQHPKKFNLKQNYPNPFNPSTTFEFSLSEPSFVSLKIYDMAGREVASVLSKNMMAGTYSKSWNAENLASGVYIYRLEAGSFSQTKMLTLIK